MHILKEKNKVLWSKEQGRFGNVDLTHKQEAHCQENVPFIVVLERLSPVMYSKSCSGEGQKFISFINCKNDLNVDKILEHALRLQFPELEVLETFYCFLSFPPQLDT